ncbi:MAG: MarR family winged helix-turn-helix transcriptional regulator [Granulosicoccus sp.]
MPELSDSVQEFKGPYELDEQIGFLLRKALQRNTEVFFSLMPSELTPTRFAVLAKLYEMGSLSQNELGRHTAMDVATTKGVVERLGKLGFVQTQKDPKDARKLIIKLTQTGEDTYSSITQTALEVSAKTLGALSHEDAALLIALLKKMNITATSGDKTIE